MTEPRPLTVMEAKLIRWHVGNAFDLAGADWRQSRERLVEVLAILLEAGYPLGPTSDPRKADDA